jgi:hypothetical protein
MSGALGTVLNHEFLAWISKNKFTFILVVSMAGNVYQYMDKSTFSAQCDIDKKVLNEQIQKLSAEEIDYERRRSEKLEFLIQALPKVTNNANANTHATSNDTK